MPTPENTAQDALEGPPETFGLSRSEAGQAVAQLLRQARTDAVAAGWTGAEFALACIEHAVAELVRAGLRPHVINALLCDADGLAKGLIAARDRG